LRSPLHVADVKAKQMKEKSIIHGKKTNHVLAIVFSLIVMASIGVFFINIGPQDLPYIFTLFMILFFAYLFGLWIYSIFRLKQNQIGVWLTKDKIVDMTNVWGITNIDRTKIKRTEIKRMMGVEWLCIYLEEATPKAYSTNLINQLFLFLSGLQAGTPILISETAITIPVSELQKMVENDKEE
jgi:hypothetical protein